MLRVFKKLVLVLANFLLVTGINKEAILECVLYIHYLIQF